MTKGGFSLHTALNCPTLSNYSNRNILDSFFVFDDESVAEIGRFLRILCHVLFKMTFLEISEHIINVVDTHVDCDNACSELSIANACWSFKVLFEVPLEVNFWWVLDTTDLTSKFYGLLPFLTVKDEQMRNDFGAIELNIVRFEGED